MMQKPFSQACENNKVPILGVIKQYFTEQGTILEIGSGTGQHAVYFAEHLPQVQWQPSDRQENLAGICQWQRDAALANVLEPFELDVALPSWLSEKFNGIFSANTVHIMSWPEVEKMIAGVGEILNRKACFCLYGPFNYGGQFTSESNARFDDWLKLRDPLSGIRNIEDLKLLAQQAGLQFVADYEMPANNRLLVWRRV